MDKRKLLDQYECADLAALFMDKQADLRVAYALREERVRKEGARGREP